MRIGIVGIGGVGGYFGGKLAQEYENSGQHEIIFIVRGQHLAAIKEKGLQLFTREGDYVVRPALSTDNPAQAGIFDLVFFCVKSYHLESSAFALKANIKKILWLFRCSMVSIVRRDCEQSYRMPISCGVVSIFPHLSKSPALCVRQRDHVS